MLDAISGNRKVNRTFFSAHLSLLRCVAFVLLASVVCIGCGKEEIIAYRVPKELPAAPLTFKTPNGWQPQAPSGMALASFSIGDHKAELSVMSFPGEGASQLNLVNIEI